MTLQRGVYLVVDGQRRRIVVALPVPFAPNAFGLRFAGMLGTNCYGGFWIEFELDRNIFKRKEDDERRTESSAALLQISNSRLMLRRLAPNDQPKFNCATVALKLRKDVNSLSDSLAVRWP